MGVAESAQALFGFGSAQDVMTVRSIRLPRVVCAIVAGGLGVDVKRTRVAGVIAASLMAAVMVSFVGLINFIGLIAPHIARRLVGDDYRFLLPASLVLGSIIMLASDLTARMVISPIILPIGAITSFLGAPLFLYLLYRGYKR